MDMYNIIPDDIKTYLDSHRDMVVKFLQIALRNPDQQNHFNVKYIVDIDCYIKFGIERYFNAQLLMNVVEQQQLDLIHIPTKYLYCVHPSDNISNDNYIVVVPKVHGRSGYRACLELDQTKQLLKLVINSNYYDMLTCNYILMNNRKIAVIDTDKFAMPTGDQLLARQMDWLHVGDRFLWEAQGLMFTLDKCYHNHPYARFKSSAWSKHCHFNGASVAHIFKKCKKSNDIREQHIMELLPEARINIIDNGICKMRKLIGYHDIEIPEFELNIINDAHYLGGVKNSKNISNANNPSNGAYKLYILLFLTLAVVLCAMCAT